LDFEEQARIRLSFFVLGAEQPNNEPKQMTITRKNPILIYLSIAVVSLLLYMNELPI